MDNVWNEIIKIFARENEQKSDSEFGADIFHQCVEIVCASSGISEEKENEYHRQYSRACDEI